MMKKFNLTNIKPLTLIIAGIGIVALILLMFVVINSFQKSRSETAGIYKPSPIPSLKPVQNREDFVKSRQEAEDLHRSMGVAGFRVLNSSGKTPEKSFHYKDLQSK